MVDVIPFVDLARKTAIRFGRAIPEHDRADLESVAMLALVESARTVANLTKEYVVVRVRGACVDHLRKEHRGAPRSGKRTPAVEVVSRDAARELQSENGGFVDRSRMDDHHEGFAVHGHQGAAVVWHDVQRVAGRLGPRYVVIATRLVEDVPASVIATELGLSEPRVSTMRSALSKAIREEP